VRGARVVQSRSRWTAQAGGARRYTNREAGKPLFVSVLMYLDGTWPDAFHAETLILDEAAQVGLAVRPKGGRLLLMDQDCPHRISSPSSTADRPRYSLVWKSVWFPRTALDGTPSPTPVPGLCRPEWGLPSTIGTAADTFAVPVIPQL